MNITLEGFKTAVLLILGNVFIIVLAVRAFGSWAKKEWGEFVSLLLGAILVGGIIYFPTQAIDILKWAFGLITS